MRALVTGASGFSDGRSARPSRRRDTRCAPRCAIAEPDFPPGVEIVKLPDLAGTVDWTPLVDGMDAVVHLAAIAHAPRQVPDAAYDRVNHVATAELARAAAAARMQRFVFISSIGAQSGTTSDHPLSEDRRSATGQDLWSGQARGRSGGARGRCPIHHPAPGPGLRPRSESQHRAAQMAGRLARTVAVRLTASAPFAARTRQSDRCDPFCTGRPACRERDFHRGRCRDCQRGGDHRDAARCRRPPCRARYPFRPACSRSRPA